MDLSPYERTRLKRYRVFINNCGDYSVQASSVGAALREVSKIRLDDEDTVIVKLDKTPRPGD